MKKILVLAFDSERNPDLLLKQLEKIQGIKKQSVFKSVNKLGAAIRKLHMKSIIPGKSLWYGNWKYKIDNFDALICIASQYSPDFLEWVHQKNSKIRIINYFWDEIHVSGYPVKHSGAYENWSFCLENCNEYDLKFNPQFYNPDIVLEKKEILYDAIFVGADRGGKWKTRAKSVKEFYDLCKRKQINAYISYYSKAENIPQEIKSERYLESAEYYCKTAQSLCVVDFVDVNFPWNTLRPLLALSNGKKLITNNKRIKDEPYYLKDNIFILGLDNENDLKQFIDSPFKNYDKAVLEYFRYDKWIERFFK